MFAPMFRKWYIEFPAILLTIIVLMLMAWYLPSLFSGSTSVKGKGPSADMLKKPPSPELQEWTDGRSAFRANCVGCHNLKFDGVGPALQGATARWDAAGSYQGKTGAQWLHIWIHNWHDAVNSGYKYAVNMANSRPAQMNVFPLLHNEDIDKILFYVNHPDLGVYKAASAK